MGPAHTAAESTVQPEETLQPVFLQDVLGHGSLHTTTTYLRRLTSDEAIDAALRIGLED